MKSKTNLPTNEIFYFVSVTVSELCTKSEKHNFLSNIPKPIDGAVVISSNERDVDCVVTFQTESILERFMIRFDDLKILASSTVRPPLWRPVTRLRTASVTSNLVFDLVKYPHSHGFAVFSGFKSLKNKAHSNHQSHWHQQSH